MMEIQTDAKSRVIKPLGRIDTNTSRELEAVLKPFQGQPHDLIVDLSECNYLSSAGIRVLLQASKQLHASRCVLYLAGVDGGVLQILEMAGLHTVFHLVQDVLEAHENIARKVETPPEPVRFSSGGMDWVYEVLNLQNPVCVQWDAAGIVSCSDLGMAVGMGEPADQALPDEEMLPLFACTGRSVFYITDGGSGEGDFRISNDPSRFGVLVKQALSFGMRPGGKLSAMDRENVDILQFAVALNDLALQTAGQRVPMLAVCVDADVMAPSLTFLFSGAGFPMGTAETIASATLETQVSPVPLTGITVKLAKVSDAFAAKGISEGLQTALSYENVLEVQKIDVHFAPKTPMTFVFPGTVPQDGDRHKVSVLTSGDFSLPVHHTFLARRLYRDASKIVINPLHGGYSAQTFQVTSFDSQGRQMGPTVMKISGKNLISRESERCRKYALPFIFNNSAVVQGTEFFGETGALRYNFVGIGGEESRLKWLTHLYQEEALEVLAPLFDKIFLTILKPWYGQPLSEQIYPFRDHDPTFTFFPFIYNTVQDVLGISAEDQRIKCQDTGDEILNPYWFLKYEYARMRDYSMEYFTGICHGDLNMQNILLDEKMNVYLIDFSETRPRAVISDFARLEAIFMIDNAPVETEEDLKDYLPVIKACYDGKPLGVFSGPLYEGKYPEAKQKNLALTLKMRSYALHSTRQSTDPLPYYLSLLEWILPVVCYSTQPVIRRRVSMLAASMLCEQVMKRLGTT
jgi:anti-anti-sigma factor